MENTLQKHLQQLNQETTLRWSKYNAAMCLFPSLTEDDMRNLTFCVCEFEPSVKDFVVLGSYQIWMAKSYIADHLQQSDINE